MVKVKMVNRPIRNQPKTRLEAAIFFVNTKVDISNESCGGDIGFPDLSNNFKSIQCPIKKIKELYIGLQYLIRHACLDCLYLKRFPLLKELTDPKWRFLY